MGNYKTRAEERDGLTGLWNRKAGLENVMNMLDTCGNDTVSCYCVLLDINDLSDINTTYSHDAGDSVIASLVQHLNEVFGEDDILLRLSGDEFLIACQRSCEEDVVHAMETVADRLKQDSKNLSYEMGFCYGMLAHDRAVYKNIKDIMSELDDRMYRNKKLYHFCKARKKGTVVHEEDCDFLYDEEYLLDALLQSTDDYIYVCNMRDAPGTFRYSKAMVEEFDLPGIVVENAAEVWGEHIHEADKRAFLESNQEIADGISDTHNVEYRARNREGKWVWLRCRGHVERDEHGNAVLFAGFITLLSCKNKVDYLTGLFNKYEFADTINQMVQKETVDSFHVIMLDIDDFRSINKLYNNQFGDKILERTAQNLLSHLPLDAKFFRCEGDEFIIVLREQRTHNELQMFYETLQNALSQQQIFEGNKYHITISAGCASFPQDALDYTSIMKAVNCALDISKDTGKNHLTFFDKDMLRKDMRELDMIEQLRFSVEHDFQGFQLYYQPQVNAENGNVVGAEALARWRCDMYGDVPPLTFIPLLERSGLIVQVGKWIFEEAVKQCSRWSAGKAFIMSINLSYLQLSDPSFMNFMRNMISKYEVNPKHIIVEMTESRIMKSSMEIQDNFFRIRDLGVRIAMDDFGTGYSSLGVLKTTPADIVKIDRIFVKNILDSEFDLTFINFIVRLCHDVDITVLLEGVETQDEYEKVKPLGLDFIQGYYFGKPMDTAAMEKLVHAMNAG